jgi:hypothetical protein
VPLADAVLVPCVHAVVSAGGKGVRGTLPQLRAWAQQGLHGVKWGALVMRISDRLQLLLQEVRGRGKVLSLSLH